MRMIFCSAKRILFLILLFIVNSCNSPTPKKAASADDHPKLIKTIGSPDYGNVQSSLEDNNGNLWFGTTENGLYRYDGKSFKRYQVLNGSNINDTYTLFKDKDGIIWIGTRAGIYTYDGNQFKEIRIPLPKNLPPNKNPYYRNSHWVYQILQAKNGNLWLATIDGLYIYDGKNFTHFEVKEAANGFLTTNDKVERMLEDNAGNIWMGGRTNEGIYRYDGKVITRFNLEELFQNGPKPKPHKWGWPKVQDKKGNIWFSNWGGAYRYDGKTFTSYSKKDGLPGIVTRIIEDKKGNIWLGGEGLTRYDDHQFKTFSIKDGLTNPWVWSILEDKNGDLWIGTRATSLFRFDGENFYSYSEYKH